MTIDKIQEKAFAKVNLTLEVLGRRADGYHELVSLVAFAANVSDLLVLEAAPSSTVSVSGPFAEKIETDNLITHAAAAVTSSFPGMRIGRFSLEKRLPVAAGIGGGSADAAAALRAIARLNGIDDVEQMFGPLCLRLGADVPVCLSSAGGGGPDDEVCGALMTGIGERVLRSQPPSRLLPRDVYAVLVNPGVQVPTGDVFRRLAAPTLSADVPCPELPGDFENFEDLIGYASASRNDLESPSIELAPIIGDVLSSIRQTGDCRLARMSGSGATCFGLFATRKAAEAAAKEIFDSRPDWWVAATRLG